MNVYKVTINGSTYTVQASRISVATHRAMDAARVGNYQHVFTDARLVATNKTRAQYKAELEAKAQKDTQQTNQETSQ